MTDLTLLQRFEREVSDGDPLQGVERGALERALHDAVRRARAAHPAIKVPPERFVSFIAERVRPGDGHALVPEVFRVPLVAWHPHLRPAGEATLHAWKPEWLDLATGRDSSA